MQGESESAALGYPKIHIEEVYEPFLIQEGFLHRTPRGRELTEKGYRHQGKIPPGFQPDLFNS